MKRAPSASIASSNTRGTGEFAGGGRGELGDAALEALVLAGDPAHAGEFPFGGLCFLRPISVLNPPLRIITGGRTLQ